MKFSEIYDTYKDDVIEHPQEQAVEPPEAPKTDEEVGGGTVMLLDGTYEIDATVNLKSNVCLAGQGRGTVLTHSDTTVMLAAPSATTITNVEVRDIYFNGNNQTGIIIDDVGTWNHCRFHDLWFYDVNAGCIDGNSGFDYCEFWNLWADNCKAFVRGDNHCSLRDSVFGKTAVKTNADNFIVGFDNDSVIEGCWINCSGKTLTTVGAVKVDENGIIRGNTFYQMYATTIKPAAMGQIIEGNNFIEDATGSAYTFAIEVQANADGLVIASNNLKDLNNTGNGCITYASGAVGGSVVGNSIINCAGGIHHTSLTSGLITGNRISVTSTEWALSIADGTSARYGDVYGNLIVSGKRSPEMRTEVFENVSGGTINAGSVVVRSVASTDGEEITTTTTSGDANVCGIAIGNISNATYSRVLTKGIYNAALVDGSGTSVAAGDYLMASTSAGKLIKATTGNTAIAIARAAVSTDTTAKIEVIAPRLI